MSGHERYIEEYRARQAARGSETTATTGHGRILVLTAAFTPMVAVAALPLTAGLAVVASLIGKATTSWVGPVLLVAAVVGVGYFAARSASKFDGVPAQAGWRRWLPLGATVVVVASCLAEIVSGSRAPDPVIVLWFASIVWVAAFLPLASGRWGPGRWALWTVGPVLTSVAILFVWTEGFFSFRFDRAVAELDALAQQVASGDRVTDGGTAGGFEVHQVNIGRLARNEGCDVELWITGWHEKDTRYIAHCLDDPEGEFTHLAGDWWQLEDRTPPSNL